MATGRGKAGFAQTTIRTIQQRASFRCIVPSCKTTTMGPGPKSDQSASTGTACHIFSAATNGPRGRGGLSDEELRSADNGVWACATHGRLIDTNAGDAYPASLLYAWKSLQEAQLKKEQDGQSTSIGWLNAISLDNTVLFRNGETVQWGKANFVRGPVLGKTALLDWISGSLGGALSDRWMAGTHTSLISITAFTPDEQNVCATISKDGISASVNGTTRAKIPQTMATVFLSEEIRKRPETDLDDDALLGQVIGVESTVVRQLVPDIRRNGTPWGKDFEFFDEPRILGYDDDYEEILSDTESEWVLRHGGSTGQSMHTLSGSEDIRLKIEFAMALARDHALSTPTLLLLDGSGWSLDDGNLDGLASYLSTQPYQTILTGLENRKPGDPAKWDGWSCFDLNGERGNATINQVDW